MDESKPALHRLTDINPDTRRAICSVCGPTDIRYREKKGSECMTVRARNMNGDPETRSVRRAQADMVYRARPEVRLRHKQSMRGWDPTFSVEDLTRLVESQHGVCAICGHPPHRGRALAIDHDHITGRVRGLLCGPCNMALGRFRDDASRFRAAAEYLEAG